MASLSAAGWKPFFAAAEYQNTAATPAGPTSVSSPAHGTTEYRTPIAITERANLTFKKSYIQLGGGFIT